MVPCFQGYITNTNATLILYVGTVFRNIFAFSAWTLLVWRQEVHLACKSRVFEYLDGGDLSGDLHVLEFHFAPAPSLSLLLRLNPVWFPGLIPAYQVYTEILAIRRQ